MAVTLTAPGGGEFFYALKHAGGMNTINNTITWSGTTNNITIKYSDDGGVNWTNIATGIDGTLGTYDWSLNTTEYDAIISSFNQNVTMRIKLVDETTAEEDESAANFTLSKVPFQAIVPSNDNNGSIKMAEDDLVNIAWSESYDSGISNVKIEARWKIDAGSYSAWTTLTASTPNNGSLVWTPSDDITGLNSGSTATVQIRITGTGDHTSAIAYSEIDETDTDGFLISDADDMDEIPHGTNDHEKYPPRVESFARHASEKAVFADENTTLSQFEAGDGIVIEQRDQDGLDTSGFNRSGDPSTTADPAAAYNIIIKVKNYVTPPRELRGYLDYIGGSPTKPASQPEAGNYYGTVYYLDIPHNWDLTNWTDYHLQIDQINSTGDHTAPSLGSIVRWEPSSADNIRVYCTVKGTDTPGGAVGPVDDDVTLDKDKLETDAGTFLFVYRLKEIKRY